MKNAVLPDVAPETCERWSVLQRRLHWGVAVLVAIQYLSQDAMRDAMSLITTGSAPGFGTFLVTTLHVWGGAAIALAVIWRVRLRSWRAVAGTRGLLPLAALVNHMLLYLMLVFMATSGVLHYGLEVDAAADWHARGKWVLAGLLGMHLAAALWHAAIKRDDVLSAMLRSKRGG